MVNDSKPRYIVERILTSARKFENPVIGCLGMTYKADVDDLRESPSLEIIHHLQTAGVTDLLVCDPYVTAEKCPKVTLTTLAEIIARSNVIVLLTDHQPFRELDISLLRGKEVVDTRGTWGRTKGLVWSEGRQGTSHTIRSPHSYRVA